MMVVPRAFSGVVGDAVTVGSCRDIVLYYKF